VALARVKGAMPKHKYFFNYDFFYFKFFLIFHPKPILRRHYYDGADATTTMAPNRFRSKGVGHGTFLARVC